MRVSRDRPSATSALGSEHPGAVVTIGNYDGVHLGHRALLERCHALRGDGQSMTVVTFEPSPAAWLFPDNAPSRLCSVYDKLALLRSAGADHVWLMRFDEEVARMSPEDFIERILVRGLGAAAVVVGEDFRFGNKREGDVGLLREVCVELGITMEAMADVCIDGERVSSSAVRRALAGGAFDDAAVLLGRRYTMSGKVVRGKQIGRELGYPTANLRVTLDPCPLHGIFAARSRVAGEDWRPAVVSLGRRPTLGGTDMLLEVHFFDFDGDLYGRRLEVDFVAKLRSEAHFDDIDDLVIQMVRDEKQARQILADENRDGL